MNQDCPLKGAVFLVGGINMKQVSVAFNEFSFTYRSQSEPTLQKINLSISKGERVLIVGPSGSGKSTLAQCINGLIPFSYPGTWEGSVEITGIDARTLSLFDRSSIVGTVMQDPDTQFVGLSVAEDIAFALENKQVEQQDMRHVVEKTARLVDVDSLLGSRLEALSGGQRQRVALAGVLVEEAEVLLFDEPLANLDPIAGMEAMELIDQLQRRTEQTLIVIEHRIEDVLSIPFDRMIVMKEGAIVADASPDEVLSEGILSASALREPLYLSLARFAGMPIHPQMQPSRMETFITRFDRGLLHTLLQGQSIEPVQRREPLLDVKQLNFRYDAERLILNQVSTSFAKGTLTSIVGQNGAGKSTLAKILSGYRRAGSGTIQLAGSDVTNQSIGQRADRVGFVLQNPNHMISKQIVQEEIRYGMQVLALSEEEENRRVEETLRRCGLYPFRNWPIDALSFGQKKRVTIASILVRQPDVLILDEPTAGQDYRHYSDVMDFLERLKQEGMTLLVITHDMHLVLEYSDHVCLIQNGQVQFEGTPLALLSQKELLQQAHLKQTSLFTVAQQYELDPAGLVTQVIEAERKERAGWQ